MDLIYRLFAISIIFLFLFLLNSFIKSKRIERTITFFNYLGLAAVYSFFYYLPFIIHKFNKIQTPKADTVWGVQYTKKIYTQLYNVADTLFDEDQSKEMFAKCGVDKIKSMVPKGVETIPTDSLYKLYYNIGESCAFEVSGKILKKWTPRYIKFLKDNLIKLPALNGVSENIKIDFCDCYLQQLQSLYPKGIKGNIDVDIQKKLGEVCVNKITKQIKLK